MSATAVSEGRLERTAPSASALQRLVVAWQHPVERTIEPVGVLSYDGAAHTFHYVENARRIEGFRPLLGFPELGQHYRSVPLFELFAQRAMDPRRTDYERYIHRLGLDPEDATPWEQIARSRRRQGDTLQLFPVPHVEDGHVRCTFLVHGHRHLGSRPTTLRGEARVYTPDDVERALVSLSPGDPLTLVPEPENRHNANAVLTVTEGDVPVGYVPDLLVEDLHRLSEITPVRATVRRVNDADAPAHLRLVAELSADDAGDFEFFVGPRWEPLSPTSQ